MEPNSNDFGWIGTAIGGISLLIGWLAGVAGAAWRVSKFDTRVDSIEKDHGDFKKADVIARLQLLEGIAANLNKVIFQERGGLNIMTLSEHDRAQTHCRSMFAKDLEQLKYIVDQIAKNTGAAELERIHEVVRNVERMLQDFKSHREP